MPKFYLQSGQVSFVVIAADAEGAALWAMHRVIDNMIVQYEQQQVPRLLDLDPAAIADENSYEDELFEPMLDGLAKFGDEIKCSQLGFGREDAGTLDTSSIFVQWRQLLKAADHLFDRLN